MNNLVRSLGLFLSCLSLSVSVAWGEVTSGKVGDCVWSYNPDSYKLVISGNGALWGLEKLPEYEYIKSSCREIEIGTGVTVISDAAFDNWYRSEDFHDWSYITFKGSTVTSIGKEAFAGTTIKSISLPLGVKTIGEDAFYASGFMYIKIPSSVTTIGKWAFYNCYGLKVLVDEREFVQQTMSDEEQLDLFKGSTLVKKITVYVQNATMKAWYEKCGFLSDNIMVTAGADSDFTWDNGILMDKSCRSLILCPSTTANVTLPPSLENIEGDAFWGPVGKLVIPASVKTINSWPVSASAIYASNLFSSAEKVPSTLQSVKVYASSEEVKKCYESYGFTSVVVCEACGPKASYFLENGVLTIFGSGAVSKAPWTEKKEVRESIKRVVVESGITGFNDPFVTSLYVSMFKDCVNLTSISLPEGFGDIYGAAFSGCTSLKTLALPSTLANVQNAFDNSNIQNLVVSEGKYYTSKDDRGEEANRLYDKGYELLVYSVRPEFGTFLVEKAGERCFASQSVSNFNIPANVTEIASNAFSNLSISKIYCVSEAKVPTNAFNDTVKTKAKVYVTSETIKKNFVNAGFSESNIFLASGKCGDAYYYAENKKLTIFGGGYIAEPAKGWPNDKFTSITFVGNSFVGIQSGAFAKLPAISSEIAIPSSIHYIGAEAFGSEKIRRVSCDSQKPADLDPSAFKPAVYGAARLLVPQSAWDAYSNALGWEKFGSYTDPYSVYDVNKDGKVNAADVSMVKKNVK